MDNNNFASFIEAYKKKIAHLFNNQDSQSPSTTERGMSPQLLSEILETNPLATFIPKEYGGFGGNISEMLTLLETSSYQSLPLSLMMGINGALFLQPVANYGQEEAKKAVFERILHHKGMGGLMITEPDYGSEALKMQTNFSKKGDDYHIKGLKHWAGLTGRANFWLMTAREKNPSGDLERDISFFIHDARNGGIEVEEYFNNLGLYLLPYGRNRVDIHVPASYKLTPKSTGVGLMLDLLHRSRFQFPGMATGFLRRLLDEALLHSQNRVVGGINLLGYDQVKERLSQIQSYYTVSSAMSSFISENIPKEKDLARMDLVANSVKTIVTDYMQAAAQSFLQLVGAKGYRLDHLAGRAIIDSRPFQIFEGSNDILYQQITESTFKFMRKTKVSVFYDFLKDYKYTSKASEYFKGLFNFQVDPKLPQRKSIQLGQIIARLISMNMTIELGIKGFNKEMISSSITTLQHEINAIASSYNMIKTADFIEDYKTGSRWLDYLTPAPVSNR